MRKALVVFGTALVMAGCTCSGDVMLGLDDAGRRGRDGAMSFARTEECGNGIDDDSDGRIDNGCPCGPGETQACFGDTYPHRGVGACRDGIQRCAVTQGTEWGDWGDYECEGDQRPTEEACDHVDNDCNGAVDDGCPCAVGDTRTCGVEFIVEPCRGGTMTCQSDGKWSGCEGAIGPSAEQCGPSGVGDGIDQDCDGTSDELCTCVPVPEICANGTDDDCDGVVDEPACSPCVGAECSVDAGITVDAGCTPAAEICNGVDDSCEGVVDEGCSSSTCMCSVTAPTRIDTPTMQERFLSAAYNDRDDEYAILKMNVDTIARTGRVTFYRVSSAGDLLGSNVVWSGSYEGPYPSASIEWFGSFYLFRRAETVLRLGANGAAIDSVPDSRVYSPLVVSSREQPYVHYVPAPDGTFDAFWTECASWPVATVGLAARCNERRLFTRRLDANFAPLGTPTAIDVGGAPYLGQGPLIRSYAHDDSGIAQVLRLPSGFALYATSSRERTTVSGQRLVEFFMTFLVIQGSTVITRHETAYYEGINMILAVKAGMAFDGTRFLGCFSIPSGIGFSPARCEYFDSAGAAIGTPFVATDEYGSNKSGDLTVRRGRCGFELFWEGPSDGDSRFAGLMLSLIGPTTPTYDVIPIDSRTSEGAYQYRFMDSSAGQTRLLVTSYTSIGPVETEYFRSLPCSG